jgi:4-hydroxy-tetrahydrodipicolinate reductase
VGSSGLSVADNGEIDAAARAGGRGYVAAGNFSVLAATLLHAATVASQHVPNWEVVDYASVGKADAPSGTARELAERLGAAQPAEHDHDLIGPPEARGASIAGTRVHSVRLPGYVVSTEVVFATAGERLVVRHEAGSSPDPYIAGTLLAIRRVPEVTGVLRGLDRLLF